MIELVKDKTFFITSDHTVKTYYSTQLTNGQAEIIVYDRNSPTGLSTLDTNQVIDILTENTSKYYTQLKQFIGFLHNTMGKENSDLYKFTAYLWNKNSDKVSELLDEDVCLSDDLRDYVEKLKSYDGVNLTALLYFEELYINQEFVWCRYSQEWLDDLTYSSQEM
jgi:hypothetical protein